MKLSELPAVCIVGRPNVGKSTLFNRIIRERKAVVHDTSGTTRDRIEALYEGAETSFRLIDTGGFLRQNNGGRIDNMVKKQIKGAIDEADLLLFVCDASSGIVAQDEELIPMLRKSNKKVLLVVNKVDNKKSEDSVYDFFQFGLGEPYPVSAIHNIGIDTLMKGLAKTFGANENKKKEKVIYKIAITGRPNVGKSLFLNTLLEEDRVIVDNVPGTTRDSVDTHFRKNDDLYLLIDTAGIRHKRKVKEAIDVYSMSRSREAIERSDVSFLLIDGYDGLRNDDVKIFNYIVESGKCCVIVVNKWDLVKKITMADYTNAILRKTPGIKSYPIVFTSAKSGRNLPSCMDMVKYVTTNAAKKIGTNDLNKILPKMKLAVSKIGKGRPKLSYIVQVSNNPPSFLIFVNDVKFMTSNQTHLIESILRKEFFFFGSPIRIKYRSKK